MEDSGIDSDSKSGLLKTHKSYIPIPDHEEEQNDYEDTVNVNSETLKNFSEANEAEVVFCKGPFKATSKHKSSSVLQKHLEKQMLQSRKFRQREQNLERMQKKLIPRSRLKVPKSEVPLVKKTDSHPLVSWESESDDEIDYHPISKSAAKEISEQLIKDGYNLDLTPDDEDLDLIPPKPLTNRCICCSLNCMCLIQ
ncbi:hypothetical protein AVEN_214540-1 [Araneus ventricosus]|uniref:Protein FAM219A n=1 Tax=Araneus ventricosus TaxID=182803 RepID=A0A4Y2GIA4_ARAVE|nr:hypothetical protein AVEN_214540-1 [Araneus ventricosus]